MAQIQELQEWSVTDNWPQAQFERLPLSLQNPGLSDACVLWLVVNGNPWKQTDNETQATQTFPEVSVPKTSAQSPCSFSNENYEYKGPTQTWRGWNAENLAREFGKNLCSVSL